jgi:hypothetical protein
LKTESRKQKAEICGAATRQRTTRLRDYGPKDNKTTDNRPQYYERLYED